MITITKRLLLSAFYWDIFLDDKYIGQLDSQQKVNAFLCMNHDHDIEFYNYVDNKISKIAKTKESCL